MMHLQQEKSPLGGKGLCQISLRLRQMPRLALLLAFVQGCFIWYVPFYVAVAVFLLSSLYVFLINAHKSINMRFLRVALCFIVFWAFSKLFFTAYSSTWPLAFFAALNFCVRVASIFCVSLPLVFVFSPYQLASSLAGMLKKMSPTRYWLLPLAILIMFSFLTEIVRIFNLQRQMMELRGEGLGAFARINTAALALFLTITAQTWDRTIAVATRGLDVPSAWE